MGKQRRTPLRSWEGRFSGMGMESDRYDDESNAQVRNAWDHGPAKSRWGCKLPTPENEYASLSSPVKVMRIDELRRGNA